MSVARMFAQPKPDFTDALITDINTYIQQHEQDFWKRTGVARAKELKDFLLAQLIQEEELTTIQLMWRVYSYIEMTTGSGKLGTSTELRNVLANSLCKALGVDEKALAGTLSYLYQSETDYMVAAANMGAAYYSDHNALQLKAKMMHVKSHLIEKGMAAAPVKSTELKDILLNAIDSYRDEVNAHWYTRWFKQSGLLRAEQLTRFICDQLIGRECLNDVQLCARVLEMATLSNGEGMLETSKDLRIALMKAMTSWQRLNLNEAAIAQEVERRIQPVVAPGSLVGYFPNPVRTEVGVRASHIDYALRNLHALEQRQSLRHN